MLVGESEESSPTARFSVVPHIDQCSGVQSSQFELVDWYHADLHPSVKFGKDVARLKGAQGVS